MERHGHGSERGQATGEYVGVLALVAIIVATAVIVAGPNLAGVAGAVVDQMRRALCIVTGGACDGEEDGQARLPCVIAADRDARHVAATIVLLRVDEDHVVLRERLSDGTVRLTVVDDSGAGLEAGFGAYVRGQFGGRSIGVGANVRVALLGMLGEGRVFHAPSDEKADELIERVTGNEGRGLPPAAELGHRLVRRLIGKQDRPPDPDVVFFKGGVEAVGQAGARPRGAEGAAEATAGLVIGGRLHRRTGRRTFYVETGRSGSAMASSVLGTAGGSVDGAGLLGYTVDARGRPVELSLLAAGDVAAGAHLDPRVAESLGRGAGDGELRGRRWELEARADPTDPEVAAAWTAYRRSPTDPMAARRLGEQLRDRAAVDTRTYRTSTTSTGASGGVAVGPKFGAEVVRTVDRASLLSARSRSPGGAWKVRADCLAARRALG